MSVIYQNGCITVVVLSGVHQPNWMSTEEAVLQACTLYSQLVLTYSQKRCFISLPRASFVNIFCITSATFPPSRPTKDNIDMSLHHQFSGFTDLIMGHNELSLPLQLWGQWNPLYRLRRKKEKPLLYCIRWGESHLFLLFWHLNSYREINKQANYRQTMECK